MNKVSELKEVLKPSIVVQRYLGQPVRSSRLGLWYRSPFRNERTASFLVNDIKGIHDFGTSKHYDIIDFVSEYFKINFSTAIRVLERDFVLESDNKVSNDLSKYLIEKNKEQQEIRQAINNWFNQTFNKICNNLILLETEKKYIKKGNVLKIIYNECFHLEYWFEIFMDTETIEQKIDLYKDRGEINKWLT